MRPRLVVKAGDAGLRAAVRPKLAGLVCSRSELSAYAVCVAAGPESWIENWPAVDPDCVRPLSVPPLRVKPATAPVGPESVVTSTVAGSDVRAPAVTAIDPPPVAGVPVSTNGRTCPASGTTPVAGGGASFESV